MIASNKHLHNKLNLEQELYKHFFEDAPLCFQSTDWQGFILQVNRMWLNTLGYSASEVYGKSFVDFVASNCVKAVEDIYVDLTETNKGVNRVLQVIKRDGARVTVSVHATGVRDQEGNLKFVHYIFEKVTEEKVAVESPQLMQLEEEINERNQIQINPMESDVHLQQVVDLAPTAIIIYSEGVIVFGNSAAAKMLGFSHRTELIEKPIIDYVHPDYRQNYCNISVQANCNEFKEERYICIDGKIKDVETALIPFNYKGKAAVHAVIRDITERKRMAEELKKISKLEGISLFAGRISHDFNNILAVILGNTSLSKLHISKGNKIHKRLEDIERAVSRAKDLTNRLQPFAKGGEPVKKVTCMAELINKVVTSALIGSKVKCSYTFSENLFVTRIDEGQMSQAINHLIENSLQAMSEEGRIFLSVENIEVDRDSLTPSPLPQGKYLKISIKDEGMGIPEEDINKIFDPFFTTKHNGNGLGLSICYSILKRHDGFISLESKPGVGTTFFMFIPALQENHNKLNKREEKIIFGKGKILVMDDEESIRTVAGEMLEYLGYQTDFAREGREAIRIYQEAKLCGKPFDAVIMDLTIPGGMGGEKAAKKLRSINPDIKIIVSSGYFSDPVISNYHEYGFDGRVIKPYRIEDISKELYNVVNGNGD